jgi:EH domain-containing protein 1
MQVDKMLAEDIAKLMTMLPLEEQSARTEGKDRVEGGAFDGVLDKKTPFMYKGGEGVNAGIGEVEWVVEKDRMRYDEMFDKLGPIDGKISGAGKLMTSFMVFSAFAWHESLNHFWPD